MELLGWWAGRVISLVFIGKDIAVLCLGPSQTSQYVYPSFKTKTVIITRVLSVSSVISPSELSNFHSPQFVAHWSGVQLVPET